MAKYTPNFKDPRVQRKVHSALSWATQMLDEHKANGWSRSHLDKKIGFAHNPLGAWLRNNLLIVKNPRYSMQFGQCKQYTLDVRGAAMIAQQLGIEYNPRKVRVSIGVKTAIEQHKLVFDNPFVYTQKSNRNYHDLQNIRTDIRTSLFSHYGFRWNYDIQNAYPTLVLQYALKNAQFRKPLETLKHYVQDPTTFRNNLAQEIGCDASTAKQIIIARFNGATLRNSGSIASTLNRLQFYKLKSSDWFERLDKDVKRAWSGICRSHCVRSMNNRAKMHFYLSLENQVMRTIKREFSKKNIPVFLEHDGWRSKDYIDPHMLKLQVKKHSGFDVNFSFEISDT